MLQEYIGWKDYIELLNSMLLRMLETIGTVSHDFVSMILMWKVLSKPEYFRMHLFIIVCRNMHTSIRCYLSFHLKPKMKKQRLKDMKEHFEEDSSWMRPSTSFWLQFHVFSFRLSELTHAHILIWLLGFGEIKKPFNYQLYKGTRVV